MSRNGKTRVEIAKCELKWQNKSRNGKIAIFFFKLKKNQKKFFFNNEEGPTERPT